MAEFVPDRKTSLNRSYFIRAKTEIKYCAKQSRAFLSEAELNGTNLTGRRIYATSAWNVLLENIIESNLIITSPFEPSITLDSLEVAQFIYLLLNNVQIRDIINTITSKVVLILGRFTSERKVVQGKSH